MLVHQFPHGELMRVSGRSGAVNAGQVGVVQRVHVEGPHVRHPGRRTAGLGLVLPARAFPVLPLVLQRRPRLGRGQARGGRRALVAPVSQR